MKLMLNKSLQGKLSVMMLISTIIPLFFFGAFSYVTSSRVNEEKTKQIGIDALKRIQANVPSTYFYGKVSAFIFPARHRLPL
ncbi:hypothetical protein [Paenibacillus cremeus]|uniref:Uncharacterized protein n=1 Tax=Paenibacillus cremeus TaxID=2163881 RepID=A0A559KFS6_9BACL|nr:hypothetical protein [Paenibacillus cremeus]TVY10982.1 hypothetical protein FPZ49_05775 [Paenibacillus cremeus]